MARRIDDFLIIGERLIFTFDLQKVVAIAATSNFDQRILMDLDFRWRRSILCRTRQSSGIHLKVKAVDRKGIATNFLLHYDLPQITSRDRSHRLVPICLQN